ncbi:MAG: hypothetical protein IJ907_02970, partial [Prevotella sp.]|nr:hypothetical protein [Prevotella sp.]
GFGTFSPSVDGQKQGKVSLADAVAAGPEAMINGIKINFNPENSKGEKLTSRALKDDCIFTFGYLVESEVRTVGGKERRVQKKTPISYLMAPAADGNSGGSNGGSQSGGTSGGDNGGNTGGGTSGGDNGGGDNGGGGSNGGGNDVN